MSGKVSGLVWELDIPHGHAWVLMSLADHAEHDGTKVFPGHSMTAWKTGYSVRQVKRIASELWHTYGLIEPVTKGGGANPTEWRVCLENFKQWKKEPPPKRGARKGNRNAVGNGDKQRGDTVAPVTSAEQRGDTHAGARRNVPKETSNSRRGAGEAAPSDSFADVMKDPGGYFARLLKTAGKEPTDRERERCFVHMKQLIDKGGATRVEMEKIAAKGFEAHMSGFEWWPKDLFSKLRQNNVTPIRAAEPERDPETLEPGETCSWRGQTYRRDDAGQLYAGSKRVV